MLITVINFAGGCMEYRVEMFKDEYQAQLYVLDSIRNDDAKKDSYSVEGEPSPIFSTLADCFVWIAKAIECK